MKRVAIFAHYDAKGVIDDYVILYLNKLKKFVDNILFISDCVIDEKEQEKLAGLTIFNLCERSNFSKDFGSYKKGFQILMTDYPEIFRDSDELIFVNDSCYCVGDFDKVFAEMETTECDAWGLADDYTNIPSKYDSYHLQSYFLAFRRSSFQQEFFIDFIKGIKNYAQPADIVKHYEEGTSQLLLKNNKKISVYLPRDKVNEYILHNYKTLTKEISQIVGNKSKIFQSPDIIRKILGDIFDVSTHNQIHSNKFLIQIKLGFPLVKRVVIDQSRTLFLKHKISNFWEEIISHYTAFDCNLIKSHAKRIGVNLKKSDKVSEFIELSINDRINKKFFIQKKVTKGNAIIIKVFRIPVFYFKKRITTKT